MPFKQKHIFSKLSLSLIAKDSHILYITELSSELVPSSRKKSPNFLYYSSDKRADFKMPTFFYNIFGNLIVT
jgi:hypothetical protein